MNRRIMIGHFADDPATGAALYTDWHHVAVTGPLARRAATVVRAHAEAAGFTVILPSTPLPDDFELARLAHVEESPTLLFVDAADGIPKRLQPLLTTRPQSLVVVLIGRPLERGQTIETDATGAWMLLASQMRPVALVMPEQHVREARQEAA